MHVFQRRSRKRLSEAFFTWRCQGRFVPGHISISGRPWNSVLAEIRGPASTAPGVNEQGLHRVQALGELGPNGLEFLTGAAGSRGLVLLGQPERRDLLVDLRFLELIAGSAPSSTSIVWDSIRSLLLAVLKTRLQKRSAKIDR